MKMMGLEIEYIWHPKDKIEHYVPEYYPEMREINNLLIPWEDTKMSLRMVKNILLNVAKRTKNKFGTYGVRTSYGYVYNGLHIHLSGEIDKRILERNLWSLISKYGVTPRIATSWHIRQVQSEYNFKQKNRYQPVIHTSFNTTEIRLLDIEYFWRPGFINDLANAIDKALEGKLLRGNGCELFDLIDDIENYPFLAYKMEHNLADWWGKVSDFTYVNKYTGHEIDFTKYEFRSFDSNDYISSKKITPEWELLKLPRVSSITFNDLPDKITEGISDMIVKVDNKVIECNTESVHNTRLLPFLFHRWRRVGKTELSACNDAFNLLGISIEIKRKH